MQNGLSKLFVITGPSGVGKGTVLAEFFKKNENVKYSISSTTRKPRPNEVNGKHYYFITREEFEENIKNNEFLEWAEYNGNYYGTRKKVVEKLLASGFDVILEIEVQGAKKVLEQIPDCVSIFVEPPSLEELERRLKGRKTENLETIKKRLKIAEEELKSKDIYKYVITNTTVEEALLKLQKIYEREKRL